MQMLLKGDYFNGRFSHPEGTSALVGVQEKILKTCPGELTLNLWEAGVYYEHTEKVIESAQKGFDAWRKLSFDQRVVYQDLEKHLLLYLLIVHLVFVF